MESDTLENSIRKLQVFSTVVKEILISNIIHRGQGKRAGIRRRELAYRSPRERGDEIHATLCAALYRAPQVV